jgi:hypothetical protein
MGKTLPWYFLTVIPNKVLAWGRSERLNYSEANRQSDTVYIEENVCKITHMPLALSSVDMPPKGFISVDTIPG